MNKGQNIENEDFTVCRLIPNYADDLEIEMVKENNRNYVMMKYKAKYFNICYHSKGSPIMCGNHLFLI